MPTSYQAIRSMFDAAGIGYYVEPRTNALAIGATGESGEHYMVAILLTEDGVWLQLTTRGFLNCPAGHKHILPVLTLVGELNDHYRWIKYGWESGQGWITAYADLFVGEALPGSGNFFGLISVFLRLLGEAYPRLLAAIQNGKDPGMKPKPAPQEEMV